MDIRFSHETIWPTLAVLAAAATIFAGGYSAGLASASPEQAGVPAAQGFPDWFLPIWDAYDRNPAVTPDFDFAGLYSTEFRPEATMRRDS